MVFNSEQLDKALYNVTDILGRLLVPFILLKETARDVVAGPEKLNDAAGIYIGIPKKEITPEFLSTINTFAQNKDLNYGMSEFKKDQNVFYWTHYGVPIYVQVIKNKYTCLARPDLRMYRLEDYRVPNPFSEYWKIRNLIK